MSDAGERTMRTVSDAGERAGCRRRPRRTSRWAPVLLTLLAVLTTLVPSGPAAAAPKLTGSSVTMTIGDVAPTTPVASQRPQPLTVVLGLHNNTAQTLRVQVSGDRGDPISTQTALDKAIARPSRPSPDLVAHIDAKPKPVTLLPASDVDVVFATTTDIPRDAGICLCHDAIYPLYFTATTTDANATVVGAVQTYVPVFGKTKPKPVLVSWLWPLLDRPHRLTEAATGNQVFLDDDLAVEVAAGGRLDKMLNVAERVAGRVSMTLVLDPDLIDEIAVMSEGTYVVPAPDGTGTTPGTGSAAAADWLLRLRALLQHKGMEVDFTPFADPDVESLHERGLSWRTDLLTPAGVERVSAALGGTGLAPHDIAWPLGETLTSGTLDQLVRQGAHTVVLNSATVSGSKGASTGNALSPVQTRAGSAIAAVTSPGIQRFARRVLSPGGPGLSELPQLVSEVAIRAVQSLHQSHLVVITPPRFLNPQPQTAARAILATAHTSWSRSKPLRSAITTVTPTDRGSIRNGRGAPALPAATLDSIDYVTRSLPAMTGMFGQADSANLLGPLPAAIQRTAAAGWVGDPERNVAESGTLAKRVRTLLDGASLVAPARGSYTLTSANSSVPITVRNTLGVDVHVRISAWAENGLPGFTADAVPIQVVAAGSTKQVKIPTHIVRTGRIPVVVGLTAPEGLPLGKPVSLTVRSTALGTVGVAITTTAGIVLVLALLLRGVAYLRRRNRPRIPVRSPDDAGA